MPFWLPNGTVLLQPDRGRGPRAAAQARLPGDQDAAGPRRRALAPLRALGQLPRDMFFIEADERRFALRPMNCPGACLVFGSERHSYRELPLRLAEFGRVSRNEREGVLHGLLRVRAFTQDDAHVYCTEEQIADEVDAHLRGDRRALRALRLRRRPGRALDPAGEVDRHRRAVGEGRGGAARGARAPGPRVRAQPRRRRLLRAEDRLPRHRRARAAPGSAAPASSTSRCPSASTSPTPAPTTPQHRPVMIHRALLGSMERFAGILIEHYAGRFPVWLAPVQAIVLPVADRHDEYARAGRRASCARPACGSRSTSARSRSARRSATPSSAAPLHAGRRRPRGGGRRGRRALARGRRAGGDAARRVRRPRACRDASRLSRALATRALPLYCAPLDRRHAKHTAPLSAPCPLSDLLVLLKLHRSSRLVPVPRRFDRRPPERDTTRINERIRVPEVRLIGADGEQVGIVDDRRGARSAPRTPTSTWSRSRPSSKPPVTRLLDYSKYKYEQEQKQKRRASTSSRSTSARSSCGRRSPTHDYETKKGHVERFLKHQRQGQGHDHVPRPRAGPPRARPGAAAEALRGPRRARRDRVSSRCRKAAT